MPVGTHGIPGPYHTTPARSYSIKLVAHIVTLTLDAVGGTEGRRAPFCVANGIGISVGKISMVQRLRVGRGRS